jgi:hypothetical protein
VNPSTPAATTHRVKSRKARKPREPKASLDLRVFVYRNLHNERFSVRDTKTGKVILHTPAVLLRDVVFQVSEAGRQRVLREQSRNVHAGAVGFLVVDPGEVAALAGLARFAASYNPYRADSFTDGDGRPVRASASVLLDQGRAWCEIPAGQAAAADHGAATPVDRRAAA